MELCYSLFLLKILYTIEWVIYFAWVYTFTQSDFDHFHRVYLCVCVCVCVDVDVDVYMSLWKRLTVYFFFVIESSLVTSGMKVTSSESLRSHPADAAVDGNVRTCYYSNRNPPKWWKLDMSRTLDILAVSIILPTSGKWNGIFLSLSSPCFSSSPLPLCYVRHSSS